MLGFAPISSTPIASESTPSPSTLRLSLRLDLDSGETRIVFDVSQTSVVLFEADP